MRVLSIDKSPYSISWAEFDYEKKTLKEFGTIYFKSKDENERIKELWNGINNLLEEIKPTVILTQLIDIEKTMKKDLVKIIPVRTVLRKLCLDKRILYNEYKTNGWEKRITKMKVPSNKGKIRIAKEYCKMIDSVEIANAIILGEGFVYRRLQLGGN